MKNHKRLLFGTYLIVLSIILCFLTLGLWYQDVNCDHNMDKSNPAAANPAAANPAAANPAAANPAAANPAAAGSGKSVADSDKEKKEKKTVWEINAPLYKTNIIIEPNFRLILLVLLAGALGGYVHASTSFASYIGNRSFVDSWYLWYLLRPFIGMGLALIFYFALRGGLLLLTSQPDKINFNPFGVGAISGLVGMFSKRASDKLAELFDTMFKTEKGDVERGDKLGEKQPSEIMLKPSNIIVYTLDKKTEENVTIKELYDLFSKVVTRIPVLDNKGAVRYVIHQSLLYKYISEVSVNLPSGQGIDIEQLKLKDFLGHNDMYKYVGESLAFIAKDETLGDARRAMEKVENCQDVFVTETGKKGEPVLGWLTNTDIAKHKKA